MSLVPDVPGELCYVETEADRREAAELAARLAPETEYRAEQARLRALQAKWTPPAIVDAALDAARALPAGSTLEEVEAAMGDEIERLMRERGDLRRARQRIDVDVHGRRINDTPTLVVGAEVGFERLDQGRWIARRALVDAEGRLDWIHRGLVAQMIASFLGHSQPPDPRTGWVGA